jgi:hypothetical protein
VISKKWTRRTCRNAAVPLYFPLLPGVSEAETGSTATELSARHFPFLYQLFRCQQTSRHFRFLGRVDSSVEAHQAPLEGCFRRILVSSLCRAFSNLRLRGDDSPNRHATKHFRETGHPIIEGYGPPEGWAWCYVDEVVIDLEGRACLYLLPGWERRCERGFSDSCYVASCMRERFSGRPSRCVCDIA